MWKLLLPVALVALVLGFIACGDDDDDAGNAEDATTEAAPSAEAEQGGAAASGGGEAGGAGQKESEPAGTELVASDSEFGSILFDSEQRAIYLFDKETSSESECYGECAAAWPPVLTEGEPQAGAGIDQKLLGTTERDDGSTQVTYDGQPLYYYVDDPKGQVLCHNVEEFGGLWLVVEPGGEAVQ